ncbi:MAG: hypothetical protein ACOZCL_07565 [Bacillota bacterium]
MDKDIKKGIKRLLLIDTLAASFGSISKIFDEADKELEEFFKGVEEDRKKTEKFINNKD